MPLPTRHSQRTPGNRPAYRGGATTFLHEHRAFARVPNPARRFAEAVLLTLVTTGAWVAGLPWLGRAWGHGLATIGGGNRVVMTIYEGWGGLAVGVPHLVLETGPPGVWLWAVTALVTALLFALSFLIPDRMTPGIYALRALLLIQTSALVAFALRTEPFPYTLADYLQTMTATGLVIATVTPVVLGFIWHVQDVAWPKKLALAVIMQAYIAVLIPLQYVLHGLVLEQVTMLFMPLLYILFGIPVHVLTLVALYAWGMSWDGELVALGVPAEAPSASALPA
ncbi:MAG: hypothetical protein AAGI91_07855 [Bacteroidota bacterium]